eukprot:gene55747-8207_t
MGPARARKGNASDRVEFNMLEKRAFGVHTRRIADHPARGRQWEVSINCAKQQMQKQGRTLRLYYDAQLGRAV